METTDQDYTCEIDEIQEPEWSELLRQFEDANLYQTWGYGTIQYGARRLTHVVMKRHDEVVAAIQGKVMRIPGLKIGIAHFTWGPMWRTRGCTPNTEHLRQILRYLYRHYAVERGLLVRVRSYEIEDDLNRDTVFTSFEEEGFRHSVKHHYQTIRLSLQPDLTELRANMSSRWRRHLRAAEKKNFIVLQGDAPELFREFGDLFREMYSRKTIVGYNPDILKYREIQETMPDHLKFIVFLSKHEGEAVAANVLSAMGDTGMYFFGATSDRAIKENLRASYLLHWQAIEWLKEHGYRWYDLRGYDPKLYPGISHFKAGLNGEVVGFAEFVGWKNPISFATVTLGEGVVKTLQAVRNRFKGIRA